MIKISILIPMFNEEASLKELHKRISKSVLEIYKKSEYEIIFIDDGSLDQSKALVKSIIEKDKSVKLICLRHNFGKSMALLAGFRNAGGELMVTMDADLQDCPEDIPNLVEALKANDLDIVSGWRKSRKELRSKKIGSWLYNYTIRKLTKIEIHDQNCGFKIYRGDLARSLVVYGHFHRFLPLQAHLLGYKIGEFPVQNAQRKHGLSKYRVMRYEGFFDLISIIFLTRYGYSPLHFLGIISLIFILPSTLILSYLILSHFAFLAGITEMGLVYRPLLALSLTIFLLGLIILISGLICEFLLFHLTRMNADKSIELATKEKII